MTQAPSPAPAPALAEYACGSAMANALADRIAHRLSEAITQRDQASLAVSGGSTPKALYEHLADRPIDWMQVTVVLVDERWVEPGTEGSNETFVRASLLQGKAAEARWVGLKTPGETPAQGLKTAEARLADVARPFDAVILGMGGDGHTASWFPHAEGLAAALAPTGPSVAAIQAIRSDVTGPLTERITLTRSALSGAGEIDLLISGASKRRAWEAAITPGPVEDKPVRALLHDPTLRLETHWAP